MLEKEELLNFLENGTQLYKKQRNDYAKRGPFQKTLDLIKSLF